MWVLNLGFNLEKIMGEKNKNQTKPKNQTNNKTTTTTTEHQENRGKMSPAKYDIWQNFTMFYDSSNLTGWQIMFNIYGLLGDFLFEHAFMYGFF